MPIIFDNERKFFIPKPRLQDALRHGTGCHLGGSLYLPSKPYYDGSKLTIKGLLDYSLPSIVQNMIETGKLLMDIKNGVTPKEALGNFDKSEIEQLLNAKLSPKNGSGFIYLSRNK